MVKSAWLVFLFLRGFATVTSQGTTRTTPSTSTSTSTTTTSTSTTTNATTVTTTTQARTTIKRAPISPDLKMPTWNYEDLDAWGKISDTCTKGTRQSPIGVSLEEAVSASRLTSDPLIFKNYNRRFTGKLANTGRSVTWTIDITPANSNNAPIIVGSGFSSPGGYVLNHIEFHWANDELFLSGIGSEHVVDSRSSPLEAQFVHRNAKYNTMDDAKNKEDGLAIIAFLFMPTLNRNSRFAANYSGIIEKLPYIAWPLSILDVTLDLSRILPDFANTGVYFRYDGSLTSPPCYETVKWTVFRERILIPVSDLVVFWREFSKSSNLTGDQDISSLSDVNNALVIEDGLLIIDPTEKHNYRPLQSRNGRAIWTNGAGKGSSASRTKSLPILWSVISTLSLFIPLMMANKMERS